MLELTEGLTESRLEAIRELEARVVRHDGGRLKLEWRTLGSRPAAAVNDLLWWEGDLLAGFLGRYRFGGSAPELAGMVDPAWRRRGIGSALVEQGLALWTEPGPKRPLLIVPRASDGGRALALKHGGVLHHSEHALELLERPPGADLTPDSTQDSTPGLELRAITRADLDTLSALMLDGFGSGEIEPDRALSNEHTRTLMIVCDGEVVGTMSLALDHGRGGVYGFVIASDRRGRGLGELALRTACGELFDSGAKTVGLEVAVENERALGLYTRLGFRPVTTEDYYEM